MANIKSQIKDIRQNEARRKRNASKKSLMKTRVKKAAESAGSEEGAEDLRLAFQAVDKAVKHGVIHKNTGARKKSLLQRRSNQT